MSVTHQPENQWWITIGNRNEPSLKVLTHKRQSFFLAGNNEPIESDQWNHKSQRGQPRPSMSTWQSLSFSLKLDGSHWLSSKRFISLSSNELLSMAIDTDIDRASICIVFFLSGMAMNNGRWMINDKAHWNFNKSTRTRSCDLEIEWRNEEGSEQEMRNNNGDPDPPFRRHWISNGHKRFSNKSPGQLQ